MKKILSCILICCFVLLFQTPLFAQAGQTITLTVPVQIDNLMDDVEDFVIVAFAYDANNKMWSNKEGKVDKSQFGADNSFNGNVTVVLQKGQGIDLDPDAGTPIRYSCVLKISHPLPDGRLQHCWASEEHHPECSHKEGTEFMPVVEGTIP